MNALIIHGMPSKEEYDNNPYVGQYHWYGWAKSELEKKGIHTSVPDMPMAYDPSYESWKTEFEHLELKKDTILIGHSCGAGFIVRWLSEHKEVYVGKVVLVAPWTDPEYVLDTGMFDFEIDTELSFRTDGLSVMYSIDDEVEVLKTVAMFKEKFTNVDFIEYDNKGHFCLEDLGGPAFPELIELITK